MGYRVDPLTADCYLGTAVLINKLDIRDDTELAEVEAEIVAARIAEWDQFPRVNTFDFNHFKAIHAHLFSDLYDWAGQIRTVDLLRKAPGFVQRRKLKIGRT